MTVPRRLGFSYLFLAAIVLVAVALSLIAGSGDLTDEALRQPLLRLRALRTGAAFVAGATLAAGGVVVQGLFRNPLASPSVLGTTAGAALGGKAALLVLEAFIARGVARQVAPEMLLPLGCVAGSLLALAVLVAVHRQGDDLVVLLLTGFLLSALFIAMGGFVTSLAQERWELARAMISFSLGDVSGVGLQRLLLASPLAFAGIAAAWLWSRPLDLMLSGEDEARSLGVDVRQLRFWCVAWTAVLTAAAVSLGGNVGFVGLIVPHALRPFVGVEHGALLPACVLAGGGFVVGCDALTRLLPTQSELPLGVVTGLIGGPVFLMLLVRSRREVLYG
ncbi:MAG: iron ABC transporter permease [Proteobacteria bacterium]|nr:iron ABC transporter permease [Pseudomonadota bacterium]